VFVAWSMNNRETNETGAGKMDKGDKNSSIDIDFNPKFSEDLNNNIDTVLNDININENEQINVKDEINETVETETKNVETEGNEIRSEFIEPIEVNNSDNPDLLEQSDTLDDDIDDELISINASLAKQISEELEIIESAKPTKQKKHRMIPLWVKIPGGILMVILCIVCLGLFVRYTKAGNNLAKVMGGKIWEFSTKSFDTVEDLEGETSISDGNVAGLPVTEDENTVVPFLGRQEDYAVNILLLGEEAIGSGSGRGRTDLIIVATLNTKDKSVKLTSLMRDTLVQIPGYDDNKLNSAYEMGGIDLLYQTIEANFDLKLDGCVMVDFESFEKVIDKLGGIEISLTANEAEYLRTTNYISKPENRDVVEGMQTLNGNQALGYCRVRKRATAEGVNNDYGRTDRQRIVLNAIFEKYKTKSEVELASTMISILPMITTDITSTQFESLLTTFMNIGLTNIKQLRIPVNGTFTDNIEVRGMDVLIPDYQANIVALHDFIFGIE